MSVRPPGRGDYLMIAAFVVLVVLVGCGVFAMIAFLEASR